MTRGELGQLFLNINCYIFAILSSVLSRLRWFRHEGIDFCIPLGSVDQFWSISSDSFFETLLLSRLIQIVTESLFWSVSNCSRSFNIIDLSVSISAIVSGRFREHLPYISSALFYSRYISHCTPDIPYKLSY